MANNGISLSIWLPDFFPPCYVFRLNNCKSLGSLQLRGKELSWASWPCPAVSGRCWPGCRRVGARARPVQIPALANRLREPIQGSECWLQPDRVSSPHGCPQLCRWSLAERVGQGWGVQPRHHPRLCVQEGTHWGPRAALPEGRESKFLQTSSPRSQSGNSPVILSRGSAWVTRRNLCVMPGRRKAFSLRRRNVSACRLLLPRDGDGAQRRPVSAAAPSASRLWPCRPLPSPPFRGAPSQGQPLFGHPLASAAYFGTRKQRAPPWLY